MKNKLNKFEENARKLKMQGNNCSYSIYNTFSKESNLCGDYPEPRSIEGKCGALLASLKILDELGYSDKKEEFENDFANEFDYNKCVELMKHDRRCNDYVGWAAKRLSEILNKN